MPEQCFSLFLGYLKTFFLQDCSLSLKPLGRHPLGTEVYVGTYGQSLSWHAGGVSRGCSQTRPVLLHTCSPAGAAHTGSSTALWCRTGHPKHKGPLWTICNTPENFYLPLPTHSSPMTIQFNQPLWNLGLEFSGMGTCTADVNSTKGGFQCLAFVAVPGSPRKCQSTALLL